VLDVIGAWDELGPVLRERAAELQANVERVRQQLREMAQRDE
jgi:hypothetical protein